MDRTSSHRQRINIWGPSVHVLLPLWLWLSLSSAHLTDRHLQLSERVNGQLPNDCSPMCVLALTTRDISQPRWGGGAVGLWAPGSVMYVNGRHECPRDTFRYRAGDAGLRHAGGPSGSVGDLFCPRPRIRGSYLSTKASLSCVATTSMPCSKRVLCLLSFLLLLLLSFLRQVLQIPNTASEATRNGLVLIVGHIKLSVSS